jgi:alpha-N-arabinofuranosidase
MMTPEYYADLFRRYGIYARNYGNNYLYKIACGPAHDDYNWTEVMMRKTYMKGHPRNQLHGLALHYYTVPGEAPGRGSATVFGEGEWFITMKKAYMMDDLLHGHGTIMDKYDPDRYVGLVVDEWGTWYDVEPGTSPGFLYQQNTLRDALVAGIHLNIFNNYAERVRIANIAQTVNVLQSVILTEGPNMVLTPTYHVFDMYKVHQGATKLLIYIESENYDMGKGSIPAISASATMDSDNRIHISLCNIDPRKDQKLLVELNGYDPKSVNGQIITSENMQDCNSFSEPGKIDIKEFNDVVISKRQVTLILPSKSVVTLEIV